MPQPEDSEDDRVCHLKKNLYGLKQVSRYWNKPFGEYLPETWF